MSFKRIDQERCFYLACKSRAGFPESKKNLDISSLLHVLNFTQQFTVECDASSDGVGAILLQHCHPIAYFRKGFSFSSHIKSTYDRELLALVLALQKWKHYLMGRHFIVTTDHFSLKYLLNQRVTTTEQ